MITVNDILDYIETFAPLDTAMGFDNCGVLVGCKNTAVSTALVCLDITPEAVNEAKSLGAELIISHHPVIFSGIKSLSAADVPYLLAKNGITALCLHTNLDLSEKFGVNTCLANALKLENTEYFMDGKNEICFAVGNLAHPMDDMEFAAYVKDSLRCDGVRFTKTGKKFKRAAVSSGAGGSEIFNAAEKGADVLVTGEIKHNQILDANRLGIGVVDAGHFKTENVVTAPLAERLSKKFPEICFKASKDCTDRICYL